MINLKILWVENDLNFPGSVLLRLKNDLLEMKVDIEEEKLTDGNYVWETVRDWVPDIIMMDHNLESVQTNGALLILEIVFVQNHDDTPIIFYSSAMDERLMGLVSKANNVNPVGRDEVHTELLLAVKKLIEDRS
jgi:hypothetical protein